ncbi:hypothetical protein V6Z12_D04G108700 [Gossypium hirsutum]
MSRDHEVEQEAELAAPTELVLRKPFVVPPPYPRRLTQVKKELEEKEIRETFQKVEINIPLLDAIKQVPRYVKFLKELCIGKKKFQGNKWVNVGENCKDQGMFSISCKIASSNVIPLSIFKLLNIGLLKETWVIIQLVDMSCVYPEMVLEDFLVKVNELIFPTDFYIIDMEDDHSKNAFAILLERLFLKDELQTVLCKSLDLDTMDKLEELMTFKELIRETVFLLETPQFPRSQGKYFELSPSKTKLLPSILQALELEFKPLPEQLRIPIKEKENPNGEAKRCLNPPINGGIPNTHDGRVNS